MSLVSIIGAGNVGANTAYFLTERGGADVLLYDVKEGLSKGKALDIMESAPIRSYRSRICGTDELADIAGSRVVVLAAGRIRTPGMSRQELFPENAPMVAEMAREVSRLAPDSVVIVATTPVDLATAVFVQESGFPRNRVFGLGCSLDALRLERAIARTLDISFQDVTALIIGAHGESFIPLPEYSRAAGVPLTQLLSDPEFDALVEETRHAGDEILALAQRSSAFYAPAAAAAALTDAVLLDLKRIFSVSLLLEGEYGIGAAGLGVPGLGVPDSGSAGSGTAGPGVAGLGVALSLPAVIGAEGINRVLTPELNEDQVEQLNRTAAELKAHLEGAGR